MVMVIICCDNTNKKSTEALSDSYLLSNSNSRGKKKNLRILFNQLHTYYNSFCLCNLPLLLSFTIPHLLFHSLLTVFSFTSEGVYQSPKPNGTVVKLYLALKVYVQVMNKAGGVGDTDSRRTCFLLSEKRQSNFLLLKQLRWVY